MSACRIGSVSRAPSSRKSRRSGSVARRGTRLRAIIEPAQAHRANHTQRRALLNKPFSQSSKEQIEAYVYALVDPRNRRIFYIGKGRANNRAFSHLAPSGSDRRKQQLIKEIREAGLEPRVEILRHGLSVPVAHEVEASLIDAIGIENLTNEVRGHGTARGRVSATDFERVHGAQPVAITELRERYMLFFVNQSFSASASEVEIYDSVRQFWHNVAERTRTPGPDGALPYPTALALVESVVVRAYTILQWYRAGATMSTRRYVDGDAARPKYEFIGQLLPEHELLGKQLVDAGGEKIRHSQKGYGYIN